jgi:hypothetical protein
LYVVVAETVSVCALCSIADSTKKFRGAL